VRAVRINALAVIKARSVISSVPGGAPRRVRLPEAGFDQPKVANAASELMVAVFGDAGKHARAAVGLIALPLKRPWR
jgi:hypothetical protein